MSNRRGFLLGLLAAPFAAVVPAIAKPTISPTLAREIHDANLMWSYPSAKWRDKLTTGEFANFPNFHHHPLLLESQIAYQRGPGEFLP